MMRRYYKQKFEACGIFDNYKQEIRSTTVESVDQAIKQFIIFEFSDEIVFEGYCKYTSLETTLKTLILSDRYNKNESITEDLDFEVVRKVLYNFNTRNLINFLSLNCNALLFFHYFERQGPQDVTDQSDVDPEVLFKEMQELYKESEKYLKITMDNYRRYLDSYEIKQNENNTYSEYPRTKMESPNSHEYSFDEEEKYIRLCDDPMI